LGILKGNRCLTPELQAFIKQNTAQLFENIPRTSNLADRVTDLGAQINVIQNGGALKKPNSWLKFTSEYYNKNCRPKGISYSAMLKDPKLKSEYEKYKNNT
jgi:hypothetical protein